MRRGLGEGRFFFFERDSRIGLDGVALFTADWFGLLIGYKMLLSGHGEVFSWIGMGNDLFFSFFDWMGVSDDDGNGNTG